MCWLKACRSDICTACMKENTSVGALLHRLRCKATLAVGDSCGCEPALGGCADMCIVYVACHGAAVSYVVELQGRLAYWRSKISCSGADSDVCVRTSTGYYHISVLTYL
jgi:hypothetical protein